MRCYDCKAKGAKLTSSVGIVYEELFNIKFPFISALRFCLSNKNSHYLCESCAKKRCDKFRKDLEEYADKIARAYKTEDKASAQN